MRSRSNSGVRLDFYQRMVQKTILKFQNPVTGLLPASPNHPHAWARDNVYSILSVWGLSLAYKKTADLDEDRAKAYELEQSVVKMMRGLLFAMMKQIDKVERFKYTQSPRDSLHAKYCVKTGKTVVGDNEWGHLQIDATSLYLLILAEMTASGLQIIYTLDEVSFVQNLVFYIQSAYRIPDFGIWERGDKTNHGYPELNSTSIGMAKAALEAMSDLDLFGARGGPSSVIHCIPDEAQQCEAILSSVLPRESNSKETDAGLLTIISYPAFAVDNQELVDITREYILDKLQGRYGLCRFLRDGYKTAKEDPNRLHYEPAELANFENIECEWPMFYAYLILDGLFSGNNEQVETCAEMLDQIMIKRDDGLRAMPELYAVEKDKVEAEYRQPRSQDRVAAGKMPQMWGQSLYVLGRLIKEGFLFAGELDPLNRRLTAEPRPDIVVQVVILAEDEVIQEKLAYYDLKVQTIADVAPIQVYPAKVLSHLFSHLGRNTKLGLSGRPLDFVGVLTTSKLYTLGDKTLAFFPQMMDQTQFYLTMDPKLFLDTFKAELQFLCNTWKMVGRPTIIFPVGRSLLDFSHSVHPALIATIKKLHSGYLHGARINLGTLNDFLSTTCVTDLTFLTEAEDCPDLTGLLSFIETMSQASKAKATRFLDPNTFRRRTNSNKVRRKSSVKGIVRRTCSIQVDDMPDFSHIANPAAVRGSQSFTELARLYPDVRRPSAWDYGPLSPRADGMPRGPNFADLTHSSSIYSRSDSTVSDIDDFSPSTVFRRRESSSSFLKPAKIDVMPNVSIESTSPTPADIPDGPAASARSGSVPWMQWQSPPVPAGVLHGSPSHPHLKSTGSFEEVYGSYNDTQYKGVDCLELVEQLADTESLHEQADIIHYLFVQKGPDWDTQMEGRKGITVGDLLAELYEKAGHMKQWWLVRHTAGMLGKKVEDLAKAATDIIVRQKQLAVGLPPEPREKIITRPLPPDELVMVIQDACGDDNSTAMLTQEVLVFLAMFIRTEPKLFSEMLRIRVGLIIQVMAGELARTLKCSGTVASDQLMNLSPYEMKTLLHHILSGKEFDVTSDNTNQSTIGTSQVVIDSGPRSKTGSRMTGPRGSSRMQPPSATSTPSSIGSGGTVLKSASNAELDKFHRDIKAVDDLSTLSRDDASLEELDRKGQWLRRRRLDGSLNRVPVGFYAAIWKVLKRCHGLSIEGHVLSHNLTSEMTAGELKFALQVEKVHSRIPQPEYRQLMVEAMMVLCLIVEHDNGKTRWNQVIQVERLVQTANRIYIEEQSQLDGDVTLCCGRRDGAKCGGVAGICQTFYDCAPSGRYGTMSYLCKATIELLDFPTSANGNLDCIVS